MVATTSAATTTDDGSSEQYSERSELLKASPLYYATTNSNQDDYDQLKSTSKGLVVNPDDLIEPPEDDEVEYENLTAWQRVKKAWRWFGSSQLLAHLLLATTLITFGGYCVLIPYPIAIMHPAIFALFRSLLIVIGLAPVTLIQDWKYSFRSDKRLRSSIRKLNEKSSVFGVVGVKQVVNFVLKKTPTWRQLKKIFWLGLFINLNQILFFMGLRWTNATIAGIMQPCVAILTCILSVLLKREGKSLVKFIGVGLAVLGAVSMLVVSTFLSDKKANDDDRDSTSVDAIANFIQDFSFTIGMLFLCLNMLCYAIYLLKFKKTLEKEKFPVLTLAFWTWLTGCIVPLLPSLYFALADYGYSPMQIYLRMDLMAYVGVLYAGLIHGTLFFILNSKASSLTTATIIGIYSTLNPIVTSIMAFLFLHERVSLFVIPGAGLILVGVSLVIFAKWREGKSTTAKPKSFMDCLGSWCGISRSAWSEHRETLMTLQA